MACSSSRMFALSNPKPYPTWPGFRSGGAVRRPPVLGPAEPTSRIVVQNHNKRSAVGIAVDNTLRALEIVAGLSSTDEGESSRATTLALAIVAVCVALGFAIAASYPTVTSVPWRRSTAHCTWHWALSFPLGLRSNPGRAAGARSHTLDPMMISRV